MCQLEARATCGGRRSSCRIVELVPLPHRHRRRQFGNRRVHPVGQPDRSATVGLVWRLLGLEPSIHFVHEVSQRSQWGARRLLRSAAASFATTLATTFPLAAQPLHRVAHLVVVQTSRIDSRRGTAKHLATIAAGTILRLSDFQNHDLVECDRPHLARQLFLSPPALPAGRTRMSLGNNQIPSPAASWLPGLRPVGNVREANLSEGTQVLTFSVTSIRKGSTGDSRRLLTVLIPRLASRPLRPRLGRPLPKRNRLPLPRRASSSAAVSFSIVLACG